MTRAERKIPFEVEISRIIEVLANQIYQSPLALLRENAQNAFDAILMRRAEDRNFDPRIDITIEPSRIQVADNGIGMTPEDLESHFWSAGSSGKDTDEARAAGVVGTFGIGAMANFGIAESLTVETESSRTSVRTRSSVNRADLSTTQDCITVRTLDSLGRPGSTITAELEPGTGIDVDEARQYIIQFVEFLDVPVFVGGHNVSGRSLRDILPSERAKWQVRRSAVSLADLVTADVELLGMANGDLRVVLENMRTQPDTGSSGRGVLIQGSSAVRTLRSGFGLATVSVPSVYRFGGVVDSPALQPTAGREALETGSNDLLQRVFSALDDYVSELATRHSEAFENQLFLSWLVKRGRYDLCGTLTVRTEPGEQDQRLRDLVSGGSPLRYYSGTDPETISAYSSEDHPLIVVSRRSPRRDCELGFLRQSGAEEVGDQPQILEQVDAANLSVEHGALAFRISRVLGEDYFVNAAVRFARMSHGIPVLVDRTKEPLSLYIDPDSPQLAPLFELYRSDFTSFGPFVKDYVRAQVFPKLADAVPSSTREGADAFLRRLRGRRELFEIDWTDREDLESIWERYAQGEINLTEAARRSRLVSRRSVVVVREDQAANISSVVPALEDSSPDPGSVDEFGPLPPVDRREAFTDALVLTGDQALNGYSCFLALSERAQQQNGEFFFQPHTTSVVWGGQKILFVFQHHSGRFGLYYDVQCPGLVGARSGGGPFRTSTLLLKDRVFIPVPTEIAHNVTPNKGERIRLEVRSDVLHLDHPSNGGNGLVAAGLRTP